MLAGHIQELALVEVTNQRIDGSGDVVLVDTSVVNSLKLAPSFGALWYTGIDWGFPEIEAVMSPFASQSGSFDETRFHRERAVSIEMTVLDNWFPDVGAEQWPAEWNSSSFWLRQLSRWAVPNKRYRLYWKNSGSENTAYWTDIRAAGMTAPITTTARQTRNVQMNFVSASGRVYSFNESLDPAKATKDGRTRRTFPFGGVVSPGIEIPIEFPLFFPGGALEDPEGIDYKGTIDTGFILRIHGGAAGSAINPRVDVTHPDGSVATVRFSGLTIPAGQFVEIDTTKMTVLANGLPSQRRESSLIAPLVYPQLQPGKNRIVYQADEGTAEDSYVETLHYDAFLMS